MRFYSICLSIVGVANSAFAAANDTGVPAADQIYKAALKEFQEADAACQKAPTTQALTRLSKAAQDLADAKTGLAQKKTAVASKGPAPGPSSSPPAETPGGEVSAFFNKLKQHGLSLSAAPGAQGRGGDGNPASFSYTQDFKKGTSGAQFNANFFLNWDLDPGGIPQVLSV